MKELGAEELLAMYRTMVLARRLEERLCELFAEGKIPGWIHSRIGQEAVGTAACACVTADDYVVPYTNRAFHVARGVDLKLLVAEIFGKTTGYCKGLAGEAHVAALDHKLLGMSGIVGGQMPIAVGLGYATKVKGKGEVVLCNLGDGASSQGCCHESLNMASVWDLPVVFVCDNNLYAEFTPQREQMNIEDISVRAQAYGIPGETVDGNDVLAVYEAVARAVERARAGKGPTLIEAKTYRWRGHFEGDPTRYRDPGELEEWKARDPIPRFAEKLRQMNILDDKKAEEVEKDVAAKVAEAIEFALEGPSPSRHDILSASVYA